MLLSFCFFNDTATTEIYTLSLHDALPIYLQAPVATIAAQRREHIREHQRVLLRVEPADREHDGLLATRRARTCRCDRLRVDQRHGDLEQSWRVPVALREVRSDDGGRDPAG